MDIITTKDLTFEYIRRDEDDNVEGITRAVDHVNLNIHPGEFITILGHNGSGKSTLAKHINAILYPTEGTVIVDGKDTQEDAALWDIRQTAGMVFQNPDNQIIGQVVEEDVGFGPENMGVPTAEIWARVEESLKAVGMYEFRNYSPNKLSGGQKQRVSIAGVIAMHPKCIILDEPTAMLDPNGRKEVIRAARALNDVENVTIILITHYMEEAVFSDRIFVMDHGKIAMQGTPKEVFSRVDELKELRLDVPQVTLLAHELRLRNLALEEGILTKQEFIEDLLKIATDKKKYSFDTKKNTVENLSTELHESIMSADSSEQEQEVNKESIKDALVIDHLSHVYGEDTPIFVKALDNVSLVIPQGQFVGIIGHTGSGKTTLIQHMNALMKPTGGTIYYKGEDIFNSKYDRKMLRSKIGLVFQYPEHQLFETNIFADVCFGPKNLKLDRKEVELRAYAALKQVGIPDELFYQSPFDLSGGQKRRVAIAGVLAMQPEILILDEPTAGLDPRGKEEILKQVVKLQKEKNITILLVSHSMEDVARYVERLVVMNKGSVAFDGQPKDVFSHVEELEKIGLAVPEVTYVCHELRKKGIDISTEPDTVETAAEEIMRVFG